MSAVLNAPPVAKFTPDDLFRLPDGGKGFELVNGEPREMEMSFHSAFVAGRVCTQLSIFVEARQLGWVSPEGTSFRCFPDDESRVRRADTAFHRLDRLTSKQAMTEGHCPIVPDLVVEVISPNDLSYDVDEKRNEWLDAGAKLVWVIHPVRQSVHAYGEHGSIRLFRRNEELTAEPVLPDFRVPVADLFKLPGTT